MLANGAKQLIKMGQATWAHLFIILSIESQEYKGVPMKIIAVLDQFLNVFKEPTSLSPRRNHDHSNSVKPNAISISVRPYMYNCFQKNEIEKQVRYMLSNVIIHPSHSPFSSLAILVNRMDNNCRFCIDYRALNVMTIKEKFPIPLVDDLIDELYGSYIYSKNDLQARYDQIKLGDKDIYKTTLKTRLGYYEFKIMPFGLTNAPTTF